MTDRTWIPFTPVTPKPWIADAINQRRAEEFVKVWGQFLTQFGGVVHGTDSKGVVDVRFPNLMKASECVAHSGMGAIVTILGQDAEMPFARPCVIQFHMSKLTA